MELLDTVPTCALFSKPILAEESGLTVYVNYAQESIGEGAFSTVLKAIQMHHGEPKEFVVKKMIAQTKEINQITRIEVDTFIPNHWFRYKLGSHKGQALLVIEPYIRR